MSNVPTYRIVPAPSRTHAENVWDVRHDYGPGYVAVGQGKTCPIGRDPSRSVDSRSDDCVPDPPVSEGEG